MLEGKNAIITGAKRGIGRATVEVFAKFGANIWACARNKMMILKKICCLSLKNMELKFARYILMLQMKKRLNKQSRP